MEVLLFGSAVALYGSPYSARVSPAIVLVARARGNPEVISIHRSAPEASSCARHIWK